MTYSLPPAPYGAPPDEDARARRKGRVATGLVGAFTAVAVAVMAVGMPMLASQDKGRRPAPIERDRNTPTAEPLDPVGSDSPTAGIVLIESFAPVGGGYGTGMILPGTDQILTAYHVVEDAERVVVELADTGDTYDVELVGYSYERDIALLDIVGDNSLPSVVLDDDVLAIGDPVVAIGNANGQGFLSEFPGEVVNLSTYSYVQTDDGSPQEYFDNLILTTSAVRGGVSGGPMFDDENEVVGVVVIGGANDTPDGMAVPLDAAMAVVEQVRNGDESGTVRIGPTASLGIVTVDSRVDEDLASPLTTQRVDGLMVWQYLDGSAARRAGVEVGDVITGIEDQDITYASELSTFLRYRDPGEVVDLHLQRADGTVETIQVELGTRRLF